MKAIVVTDQAAGTAGMTLVERPEPQAAINDVVVQVHASGFTSGELTWPSTWTDRLGRDRTPSIPGQELAGVVTALGYGTRGLSVGQRVLGLANSYRGGTLAEYVAIEARNLAPLPGDVDFTVGASVAMPGLTALRPKSESRFLRRDLPPVDAFSEIPCANEPSDHLITVSLALATIAANSSSVMSMARLKTWVSEVLNVGALP